MPVELAGISLTKIHEMNTLEQADFVSHRVPGLEGDLTQNMGRSSVRMEISGIFYGDSALENMETLRDKYKSRSPVDFLADIVGQAYFAQVIIDVFATQQRAQFPDQFDYHLVVAEYVEPPEPEVVGLADVDASILDEAADFMDIAELPGILALPEFSDPTAPLAGILGGVENAVSPLTDQQGALTDIFGE